MSPEQQQPSLGQLLREEARLERFIQKNTYLSEKLAPQEHQMSTQVRVDLTADIRLAKIRKLREHAGRASNRATTHLVDIQTEMEIFSGEAISRTLQYTDQLTKSEAQLQRARSLAHYLTPETLEAHEARYRDDQSQVQHDPYVIYGTRLLEKQKASTEEETSTIYTPNNRNYTIPLPQSDTKLPVKELRKGIPISLPDGETISVLDEDVTIAIQTLIAIHKNNPSRTIAESDLIRVINSTSSSSSREAPLMEELAYRLGVGTNRWKLTTIVEKQPDGRKIKRYKLEQREPKPITDKPSSTKSDITFPQKTNQAKESPNTINLKEQKTYEPEQLFVFGLESLYKAIKQLPELATLFAEDQTVQKTLQYVKNENENLLSDKTATLDATDLRINTLIEMARIYEKPEGQREKLLQQLPKSIKELIIWLNDEHREEFLRLVRTVYYDPSSQSPKYTINRTILSQYYPHVRG